MGKFEEDLGTSRLPGKTSVNPFFPPTSNAASNRSQAWGGEGLGRLNMKHGEGFGLPMLPRNRVERVHEKRFGCFMGRSCPVRPGKGLGVSWFSRMGWEGFRKAHARVWAAHTSE